MATLLKIANEKYIKNVSHEKGFSLNGGIRNNSYIGQTSLARTYNKTPFTRNHEPYGSGGNKGKYNTIYTKKPRCCVNNPSIIKKSVLNTKGMISKKYKWTNSSYPNTVVQPDSNFPLNYASSSYVNLLKNTTISKGMDNNCVQSKETININANSSQARLSKLSTCFTIETYPPRTNNTQCHSM